MTLDRPGPPSGTIRKAEVDPLRERYVITVDAVRDTFGVQVAPGTDAVLVLTATAAIAAMVG